MGSGFWEWWGNWERRYRKPPTLVDIRMVWGETVALRYVALCKEGLIWGG